ncbi:MAG TPA: tetratricopeptide repeat protein [Thermoanaerobaculia bacterium]
MVLIEDAVRAVNDDDYLRAMTMFLDIYGDENSPELKGRKAVSGLSYFGLTIALIRKQYKPAIELCRRAIELEFYNGDHYANLGRVYLAAGNRRKAVETVEQGLKNIPEHGYLLDVRRQLGVRARPPVPFLDRTNPINVSLGQARHAKKVTEVEKKSPKR